MTSPSPIGTVVLIRHGIAEDRGGDKPDALRELTPKGAKRALAVLRLALPLLPAPDRILSSPYRRANQTAHLIAHLAHDLDMKLPDIELDDRLTPDEEQILCNEIGAAFEAGDGSSETVWLVGHNPSLEALARRLCGGEVILKKAGVAVIEQGGLVLLLKPKLAEGFED
ncbi:MAG: phosphohistidine phosphatase SixA [Alphaproteobacteria bacterium CG_4_10_14_0_2_um_filter_63_37]|nr:MAG: hypothetical protein AUJ55_04585 [Proteobacteria bacterium CG1_02_64_396]PJA23670.1 MAG: phosphohistidine phosphatase SixA [Alphaproteobacteria bacterium CG_4_10_14_0_2_um_filter_63_37]